MWPWFCFSTLTWRGRGGESKPSLFEMALYFAMTGTRNYDILIILQLANIVVLGIQIRKLTQTHGLRPHRAKHGFCKQRPNMLWRPHGATQNKYFQEKLIYVGASPILYAFLLLLAGTCQNMQTGFCACVCTYRRLGKMVQTYEHPYRPLYRPLGKMVQTYRPLKVKRF